MGKLRYEELSYKIRGIFFEIYNALGPGFKESIYHNALVSEFKRHDIDFKERAKIPIFYKKERVGVYEPDFIVEDKVLIEIKAVPSIIKLYDLQLYYYLKGTHYNVGFLVNFGSDKIEIKRRIQD